MIKQIITIYDRVAQTHSNPFCTPTTGAAIRMFTDEINRAADNNMLYQHPEDHDLVHLGSFDDETASFMHLEHQKVLMLGKDAKVG